MNKVIVVGPTYRSEIIKITKSTNEDNRFLCTCKHYNTGGCYSIAKNLAALNVDVDFVTRIAYDQVSTDMMMKLEEKNVAIHTHIYNIGEIPTRIYSYDKLNKLTILDDFSYNIYPSIEDGLPFLKVGYEDYCVFKLANGNYIKAVLESYKQAHFISIDNIPMDEDLNRIDGLIISEEECLKHVQAYDYQAFAISLLKKGLKWVIIENPGKRVRIYNQTYMQELTKEECGDNLIGAHEVFISKLLQCLSNNFNLQNASSCALDLANEKTYYDELTIE